MANKAYLTIDDGPSIDFRQKLAFLEAQGIKAIWFCLGTYLEQGAEMVVKAIRAGHIIASHSYSHPYFSELTTEQCFAEIQATHIILEDLHEQAGVAWDKRYFRFPFGDDGSGTELWQRLQNNAPPATPERAQAIQAHLCQLGYEQAYFEGVTHPFFLDYCQNHVDVFLTYDAQDWQISLDETEDGQATISTLLVRMDAHEPEALVNLSDTDSGTVLCFHDMHHPQSLALFKQMVLKVFDKGFVFAWPP